MDATTQLQSSKNRKFDANADDDTISKFPDCFLHYILSFLPMKDVVRTSVLSTRWRYIWTSISDIDLDDSFSGNSVSRKYFLDFVERVLLLHDASDIRRFRLAFDVPVRASRVNSWVSAAVRHNLQELDLSYLPSSLKNASIDLLNQRAGRDEVAIRAIRLLNCIQNVKSLRISGDTLMSLECAENLPSHLPTFYNLTTLEVDSDTSSYKVGVLMDFLRTTPNLEFLDIEGPAPDGCIHQEELTLSVVPKCFESNLRTISYSYFDGKDGELYLLKFLLERAMILKTMMIY